MMFEYHDPVKNWRRIKPHIDKPEVRQRLVEDFSKYITGQYGQYGVRFDPTKWPRDYESYDWELGRRGRPPGYFKLVKHSACHWLVNTGLLLAQHAAPRQTWQIVTSGAHSTVWDGAHTLFDLNFTAFGIDPGHAWELARIDGDVLSPDELLVMPAQRLYLPHL